MFQDSWLSLEGIKREFVTFQWGKSAEMFELNLNRGEYFNAQASMIKNLDGILACVYCGHSKR